MPKKPAILKRLKITDTDVEYLTTHYVKLAGTVIFHNVLKDMSTACGMPLICAPRHVKPRGEPRCKRCIKTVNSVLRLTGASPK